MQTFRRLLLVTGLFTECAFGTPKICNIRDYGARGNGTDLDTAAIQSAVQDCQGQNGFVDVPPGTYLSGMITLGSNMTLHLESGATILGFRGGDETYPDLNPKTTNTNLSNCRKALLFGDGVQDLTIEGDGTIDGNGGWSQWSGTVKEAKRPMAIFIFNSSNLVIRDIHIVNPAMWGVVLMETKHSHISGINIHSPFGPTRDGIDICDGSDIVIDHVQVYSEDDSICLKSGLSTGLQHVVIQNSQIENSTVANGVKFGTVTHGTIDDVLIQNIKIRNVRQAAMAVESVDGSQISNITFQNISVHQVGTPFYVLLGWRGQQVNAHPGSIAHISFKNIQGDSLGQTWGSAVSGSVVDGIVYTPQDILFQDLNLRFKGSTLYEKGNLPSPPQEYQGEYPDPRLWKDLPAAGLFFRHVQQVHLRNVNLEKSLAFDRRPMIFPVESLQDFDVP